MHQVNSRLDLAFAFAAIPHTEHAQCDSGEKNKTRSIPRYQIGVQINTFLNNRDDLTEYNFPMHFKTASFVRITTYFCLQIVLQAMHVSWQISTLHYDIHGVSRREAAEPPCYVSCPARCRLLIAPSRARTARHMAGKTLSL